MGWLRKEFKMKDSKFILDNKSGPVGGCCIYFLISNNKIVYVGKSVNSGFDRIGAHLKYSDKVFDSYFIEPCPGGNITEIETEYIIKFAPKYNKSISSNRKYATRAFIMGLFKFWSDDSFLKYIKENKIKTYGEKYFKIEDFILGNKI